MRFFHLFATKAIALVFLILFFTGCKHYSDESGSIVLAHNKSNKISVIKLYTIPNAQPNLACDIYTRLTLPNVDEGKITLQAEYNGDNCPSAVAPQLKEYRISGVTVNQATGTKTITAKDLDSSNIIKIVDHRHNTIAANLPALVIVEETWSGRKLYSN